MSAMKNLTFELLKTVRWWIFSVMAIGAIWAIDLSLRPYILKVIIDRIGSLNPDNVVEQLMGLIALYISISLLIIIVFRIRDYIYLNINAIMKCEISEILTKRMMQHSLVLFQNNFSGNLANKIKDVMSGFPDAIKYVDELFAVFLSFGIAIFTLSTINYQFAILLFGWMVFFISISLYCSKKAQKLCIHASELTSQLVGRLVDILSNIISIKLFASREYELAALKKAVTVKVAADKKREWYFLWTFAILGLSFVVYQAVGFSLLIYWFKRGIVTTGDFALLTAINISIVAELWHLSQKFLVLTETLGNIRQGLSVALQPIDVVDKANAWSLEISKGNIIFDKVTFNYPGIEPIFAEKSVSIVAGQKVGLVGYSGGGKTTFVNLILRLYDVTGGKILIDGQNICDVAQDSLHLNISMIPQDPALFHRSLMENIRYGRHDATDTEVIAAAKQANIHQFIMSLPEKYDTLVGDRGVKLSGGQRQRIAIARAILKNAKILILDEATSQLDSITENEIQSSLWNLMQHKTTIVVAHRLATLLQMDRILVFSHGKIVEDGSHQDLLNKNGLYRKLWDAQVGGFLLDAE